MNPTIKPAPEFQYCPSAEYRFFLIDPEGNGMTYFWSKEKRDAAANEAIKNYLDDDVWSKEVEWVCAGEVTHAAQVLDKTFPPPASELDEDGFDGEGYNWGDVAWRGDYTLEPLPEPMLLDSLCQQSSATSTSRPRIGEYLTTEGGVYVGDILGDDKVLYGLIVGEEMDVGITNFGREYSGDLSQWDGLSNTNTLRGKSPAADLAANYERSGHCDFYLPARRELIVPLANAPHLFNPKDYYWTSTTRGNDYAWAVDFENGYVDSRNRDNEFRVRPFRRFIASSI